MVRLALHVGFEPLLERTVWGDLVRSDAGAGDGQLLLQIFIHAKDLCGVDGIGKEFADEFSLL